MKKLLNGIFRPSAAQSSAKKPDTSASTTPTTGSSSSSSSYVKRTQSPLQGAAATPPTTASSAEPTVYRKTGPRSSWDTFFASTSAAAPRAPATPPLPVIPTPEKVFNQNLDILVREAIAKIKVVIAKMLASTDFQDDLAQLSGFVTLAADKLQQNGEPAAVVLRNYFASPAGTQLCEQTAFPSLVLDFLDKVRAFLLREELQRMAAEHARVMDAPSCGERIDSSSENTEPNELLTSSEMERSIEFLMGCVQAIASNTALMEIYRCEVPNLIQLSAEEYPPSALFLRDLSSQALAAVSDRNFNAGLVWYLHDCGVVAKTVKRIAMYSAAAVTTPAHAAAALEALLQSASAPVSAFDDASGSAELAATAAAVSDALGLSNKAAGAPSASVASDVTGLDLDASAAGAALHGAAGAPDNVKTTYCLASYDALVGIKSLVYILQKTCRHSLVLLGEFQSSGGYALMTQLLRTGSDANTSTLIYLFTLLLPLGTGFSGASGGDENMATIITCGARNVGAFVAMRDLLLKCISDLELLGANGESDRDATALADATKARDEQLILQLLTTILHVYTSDYDNFWSLEPKTQTLALVLTKLPWIAFYDAKVIVLRIVEYVCAAAKSETAMPTDLLSIVCSLFIECTASETARLLELPRSSSTDGSSEDDAPLFVAALVSESQASPSTEEPSNHSLALLLCSCIVKILQNSNLAAYRDELHAYGLLERGIYAFFVKVANALTALASADRGVKRAYLSQLNLFVSMWSTVVALMLRNNWTLGVAFRELQVHQSLYTIADALVSLDLIDDIPRPHEFRSCVSPLSIFAVFAELATFRVRDGGGGSSGTFAKAGVASDAGQAVESASISTDELQLLQSGVESDLTRILGALQTHRGAVARQCVLLRVLKHELKGRDFVWGPWQSCQGHEVLLAILSSITGVASSGDSTADSGDGGSQSFVMMDAILELLSDVLDPLSGDDANRAYFKTEIGYATIATCLATSGVLETDHLPSVINRVFELITGSSPPRNKVRNADAVLTLFTLVPRLDADAAVTALARLLRKLTSNDEVSFSRKKQAAMLVHAGAFRWLAEPAIARLYVDDTPLRAPLTSLILVLARDELTTSQLREFLRVVARGMPRLLGNEFRLRALPAAPPSECEAAEREEVGLSLLAQAFTGSRVPHVPVGTQVKTRMASGYVHVVNSTDRRWPPSSGYSFACWVRFPAEPIVSPQRREPTSPLLSPSQSTGESSASIDGAGAGTATVGAVAAGGGSSDGATVSVALCEGHITIALDGDDTAMGECYCVLVGPALTFFGDSEQASQNEPPIKTLDVTAVASSSSSELEFYFWSHEQRFFASCRTADDAAMWLRAMQQSESISNVAVRNRHGLVPDASGASGDELLFVPAPSTGASASAHATSHGALDGFVCLLSVYSIESAGCYVRIYFEQTTGCLRVDTGSVSSGPNMNPTAKRTTATFKNIDMTLLRASSPPPSVSSDARVDDSDDGSHWHHLAFTHRKSVVGSSLLTLYIDGSEVTSKKLSYPSAPTTGGMQAFIGKDIQVCGTFPALSWSLGPTWFMEDVLSPSGVACMFLLGPSFSGQFSGHAYRSAGDWPEAHATAQLDRATQRRVDIVRMAKRLQLAKLGRASRRQWADTSGLSSSVNALVSDLSAIAESTRRDDAGDGFRFPTSTTSAAAAGSSARKEQQRIEAFQRFVKDDCAMSALGNELLQLLSSFRIADDLVLFSLSTIASGSSNSSSALTKTQGASAAATAPTTALSHIQIQYVGTERSSPLDLPKVLPSVGGVTQMLFPLLENAWRPVELRAVLDLLAHALRQNPSCLAECLDMNGYALTAGLLVDRVELVDEHVLAAAVRLAISSETVTRQGATGLSDASPGDASRLSLVVDATALSQLVLSNELRRLLPWRLQCQLVGALLDVLDPANPNALFNARQLRRAGLLAWLLLYVSELCNDDCSFVKATTLERRWCFPDFAFGGSNELLQRLLALMRAYMRVENHVDDVFAIADQLLLSLTTDSVHRRDSPVRVVLLQFLLHEVESDEGARKGASSSSPSSSPQGSATGTGSLDVTELVAPTLVDAVLYRYYASVAPAKKRKDKSVETASSGPGSTGGVFSPTAGGAASSQTQTSILAPDGVDVVLLEIISRTDSGPFASTEALLALRLLLSLAQAYTAFAQYLFQSSPALLLRIKRSMLSYSTDANVYIPLLAYVSNVAIKDTPYCDSVASPSARLQQYAQLPPPRAFAAPDKCCADQVWELLGSLLLHNCRAPNESSKAIAVAVLAHVAYQTEVSEAFFTTLCASASTVFRIVVQCLVCQLAQQEGDQPSVHATEASGANEPDASQEAATEEPKTLQYYLSCLFAGRAPESFACELAVACLDVLKTVLSRSLFERDEFAAFMMFVLECLDDSVARQSTVRAAPSALPSPALADAQKCWLALLVHIVKSTQALSENCSLLVLRNVCTLGVALSRYLVDTSKHQGVGSGSSALDAAAQSVSIPASDSPSRTESRSHSSGSASASGAGTPSCFGTDVLVFFLSSVRMCAEPHIAHAVGSEDQQFVYGCLVYCTQTVLLSELNGFHRGAAPPPRLLDCLVGSKHLLLQQTKCSSVIVCGTFTNHHPPSDAAATASSAVAGAGATGSSSSAPLSQGGFSGRLNRMRSLSANAHKEFGVGAESDRSFLLSLAAELFRMLIDDDERVRHAAILTWQFLLQHRMGVLKELLIVEPRVSLLQNITTSKKEAAIDVFHGGFERLLHVSPQRLEHTASGLQTQQLTRSSGSATLDAVTSSEAAAAASASSRESWLQFHIWLTDNFDLLRDLILVRTEPIYHHLLDVLLSCLCVRKVNSTSAAMRLTTQADAAISVDFALYFDATEHSAKPIGVALSDGDVADTSAFRIAARKTLFKLSNARESSLDAMADAQARWRETLLQLLHTRSVWQMEGWRVDASTNQRRQSHRADQQPAAAETATPSADLSVESTSFYVERSIFQQNAFKHRLDATEGPQRMRLRLVRSYESWSSDDAAASAEETSATAAASRTSSASALSQVQADRDLATENSGSGDLFKQSRELHEAVEVFRAFHFKLTTHSRDAEQPLDTAAVLADIASRATCERTREAFAPESIAQDRVSPLGVVAVARRLCSVYIRSKYDTSAELAPATAPAISEATIAEIERLLAAAEAATNADSAVPATIFDVADSELMQATLPALVSSAPALESAVRALSPAVAARAATAAALDSDDDADDDEEGVAAAISPVSGTKRGAGDGDDSDEDVLDQDESGDGGQTADAIGAVKASSDKVASRTRSSLLASACDGSGGAKTQDPGAGGDHDDRDECESPALAPEKAVSDIDSTIFDSSYDYTYGGIARFLDRDDYAPLRCYNAIYIAGMDKIDGLFAVCRHALYFIGGYEKLFYHAASEPDAGGGVKGAFSTPLSPVASASTHGAAGSGTSNPLSPGKASAGDKLSSAPGASKKKAKNLLRSTLADLSSQFSHAKSATSQLFTVVPLLALPDQTSAPGQDPPATHARAGSTKRWSIRYANVKQFSRIKYQLRPVGIEFFDTFGATFFLQFESQSEREDVIKLMFQMPIVNSIFWNPLLRSSALSLSVKRIRQALTKRWLRGAVSNFEYLMHLNTLAGRSFNDITQYPVFPWIVADYTSAFLDLDDSATFRDLSKPMGALGASRAAQFRERYAAMSDVGPGPLDTPAFHYGTHYSCSAYVVNYLIRLEPFTQLARELQGGCFDHADRLFCNIPSSWKSASTDNLQDVRELIPEFFYLPEFLYNANGYDFGTTQSGDVVSHVRLPPWAHGDPREFVRLHRRALESKYVSEHLHEWIDLVFGVKQTGAAALEAQNVFMHVTYEGTVDIDAIEDPVMRTAMLSQIEHFGQTPSRIFSTPHPPRRVPTLLSSTASVLPPPSAASLSSPVTVTSPGSVSAVGHQYEGNTLSSIEAYVKWHTPLAPALVAIGKDYVFLRKVLALKALDEAIGDVKLASNDKVQCRGAACTFVPPRFTKYVDWSSTTAGDGTIKFRVHQSSARYREANKVIGVIEGAHYCRVTCATFSDDGLVLVTGGQDGVVNVLECLKANGQRVFKQFAKLVGHEDAVESVAINKEFNVIASGSADCCVILWDLRTRAFLRELVGHAAPVTHVAINSANANILTTTATDVRIWSINGDLLAATSTLSCGLSAITSAIATRCDAWQHGVVAVTGHSNGTIALWGLSYPSGIEQERRARAEMESSATGTSLPSVAPPTPLSSTRASGGARPAVRIGVEQASARPHDSPSRVVKAVPTCQLFIMKLLLDHRASVTALTLGVDQRQLLSGDADGNCIRWVDDSISTNIL